MTVAFDDPAFEAERPRLTGLAYRITGSRTEAEDIVQDAWLRWQRADRASIERPPAWFTTVTSRLALDRLKAARHQREVYVGPWLPEPVCAEPGPDDHAELAESLTIGFLAVLERLGPTERVVFLLADVFEVPYVEIAQVVDRSVEACRQVASRARRRVQEERPRYAATDEQAWEVTAAFLSAAQRGDLDTLVELLAEDALVVSDGGPDRHAARRPVAAERIPRLVANLARRGLLEDDEVRPQLINGQPGILVLRRGQTWMALAVAADQGSVSRVWAMLNPDKLGGLTLAPMC